MNTRRNFLKRTVAAVAGTWALQALGQSEKSRPPFKIGYIGGIVKEELANDWRRVLDLTAEYGFTEIEIGSPPGDATVQEFLSHCAEVGIKPVAGGVPMTEDADALRQRLDGLAAMNIEHAVVYWPWFTGEPFSLEDCRTSARVLNEMGEICRERGLTLCWHNHDHEFKPMVEGVPFDYLMKNTDEKLVKCELDVYWAAKGGADPVACLQNYPGRYAILHLKDMTGDDRRDFECVGQGVLDFPSIIEEALNQGVQHYMVERDKIEDGLACLKSSGRYLRSLSV